MALDRQIELLGRMHPQQVPASIPARLDAAYWQALIPADNQLTAARVALGKRLYFDPRLSRDGTVACATCHDVSRGFTDLLATSEGIEGKHGRRNSPTSANAALLQSQFWDGRAPNLEEQAKLPVVNPVEMGHPNGDAVVSAVSSDAAYQAAFMEAYGRAVNFEDLARALASFERTLIFLDAPFDRFAAGAENAMSAEAIAGWALFNGKGRCSSCHHFSTTSPVGTNNKFHNVGVSARHQDFEKLIQQALSLLEKDDSTQELDRLALETDLSELGRFVVTRHRADIGAFKTPQLRNTGVTAPYMHDGSLATLWDVMDHYNKGGEANPFLDGGIEPLDLTEREIDQLVAFMFALTDYHFADQGSREFERQRAIAVKNRPIRDAALASRKVFPFETRAAGRKQ